MENEPRHRCLIYEGAPSVHLPVVVADAALRLADNYRCLYLNSPVMVAGFRAYLAATGVDTADATARGSLVLSSDQEHLAHGEFDPARMLGALRTATEQALADGYAGLWATGDMLWEFGSERNLSKLLAYEVGLEELIHAQPGLCGICQYHRDVLPTEAIQVGLFTHRAVYLNQTLCRWNTSYQQVSVLRRDAEADPADHIAQLLADLR